MRSVQKYVWIFLLLAGLQSMVSGGVWTTTPWTDDVSTGIDSAKTYTHAINFTDDGGISATLNGVSFTNSWGGDFPNGHVSTWGWVNSDDGNNITGNSYDLSRDFRYGCGLLTLTGLTPGGVYELTLFSVAWENGTRTVTLTDSFGSFVFNQDEYGNNNGIKIVGIYRADTNGELNLAMVDDFHFYGFTNCEYSGNLPVLVIPIAPEETIDVEGVRIGLDTVLSWDEAISGSLTNPGFDVYMDSDEDKVTALDPTALVSFKQSVFGFDPDLDPGTLYYWTVATYLDINDAEPNQVTEVLKFKTEYTDEHWSDHTWTGDSDSGISTGKEYTHAVNFNAIESIPTIINGVEFENSTDSANPSGVDWNLSGVTGAASGSHNVGGEAGVLGSRFFYGVDSNDVAILTLTGLTPGENYLLSEYTRGWGDAGGRYVRIATSADGRLTTFDQNLDGDSNGHLFQYRYTAPASGELTVTFNPLNLADTWHHYAFSNEVATAVYLEPSPLPGSSVSGNVELSWELKGTVTVPTYNLRIATDSAMTNLVFNLTDLSGTTYAPGLQPDTQYYWQMDVIDGSTLVYTSPVWDFQTTPPPDAVKVLEWKFDETTGIIAAQTGPSEDANGTLVGFNDPSTASVRVTGLNGNGLSLNGKDEYVDVSSAQSYMPTADGQSFGISGYFRTFKDYGPLFSMRNEAAGNPIIDIAIGFDGSQVEPGKVCLLVRDDVGSISKVNSGTTVNDGRWHNFVVTRVIGKWTLYVDGVSCATINGAATGDVSLDLLSIGASIRWMTEDWPTETIRRDFAGILDEYTIWDGQLQPHQIAELASIVPPQGDIDFDLDVDMNDLVDLTTDWLANTWTPVQPAEVLEDMQGYTSDPNTYKDNWTYTPEADYADVVLSVIPDPNNLANQFMQMAYDFSTGTNPYAHVPVTLPNRGVNMGMFDQVEIRIKKLPGCDVSQIILDFFDGRDKVAPSNDDLYYKGRINIDVADDPMNEWITVSGEIPGDGIDLRSCTDLYQIMFAVKDGGEDTGTLLIDSIKLIDSAEDCISVVGQMLPDMNGDCAVNLLDFAELAQGWLNGI